MAMKPGAPATPARLGGMMGTPHDPAFGTIMLQRVMTVWTVTSFRSPSRVLRACLLVIAFLSMPSPLKADSAAIPEGVWLVDPDSAVQIFDRNGLLCGRVVWLRHARDPLA
jgi:hypothetical protein